MKNLAVLHNVMSLRAKGSAEDATEYWRVGLPPRIGHGLKLTLESLERSIMLLVSSTHISSRKLLNYVWWACPYLLTLCITGSKTASMYLYKIAFGIPGPSQGPKA